MSVNSNLQRCASMCYILNLQTLYGVVKRINRFTGSWINTQMKKGKKKGKKE